MFEYIFVLEYKISIAHGLTCLKKQEYKENTNWAPNNEFKDTLSTKLEMSYKYVVQIYMAIFVLWLIRRK